MSKRQETVDQILRRRVSAIIRTKNQDLARDAMRAAVDGGIKIVEFTLTTPGATELIAEFAADGDLLVGAGTVLSVEQARMAALAGARFLVSPVCDPAVVAAAAALDLAVIPGTYTPTEMQLAHHAGADFVKLFPAPTDAAAVVKAILGPLPHLRIFPTAGVFLENFVDVLRAGAAGVGFVRSLFEPDWMANRQMNEIRTRAEQITRRLAETE